MPNYLPKIDRGAAITRTASADVTGGRVVEVTTSKAVAMAGADSAKVLGVALHDAKSGEAVTVSLDGVQRPVASGAITAGAKVYTAAGGAVSATGTTNPIGIALETVADGAQVDVQMNR
ncbi:hypothetical protein AESSP_00385 [Aestuariimicrobium sp. T2.26MG-19.2B]|nr:hypothetical protein AESSP_00385 [Aestuariimicrobium sp. T2.26MG-19.2B]